MGCASTKHCRRRPTELYRVGEALPETSNMPTEELLRRGIASAQEASCGQRCREARVRHVLLARRYLTAALQRYSRPGPSASPEISAHLLAVLLKLGEDAQSVQGILADFTGLFDARANVGTEADTPHSRNSSSGSSIEVNTFGYDEMKENFLSPDSSDEEHGSNSGAAPEEVSPSTNPVSHQASNGISEQAFPRLKSEDSSVAQVARGSSEALPNMRHSSPTTSPSTPSGARWHVRDAVQDAAAAAALTVSGSSGSPVMRLSSLQAKAARNREARRHQTSNAGSQAASDSETGSNAVPRSRFPEIKEHGAWGSVIDEEGPHPENEEISSEVARQMQRTASQMSSALEVLAAGDCFLSPATPQRGTRTISGVFDTMSISASCAPSMAPSVAQSPHVTMAMACHDFSLGNSVSMSPTNEAEWEGDKDTLLVRILSPVDGKEELRFRAPLEADSEQQFLATLDRLCLHHVGQPLAGLNWLIRENEAFDRWQRRRCDVRMVEDLFDEWQMAAKAAKETSKGGAVLHLCTIPVQPATELPRGKVRLKRLSPMRVTESVPVQLETTALEVGPVYSVAFTSQWSNMTYSVEAKLLPNNRGVEALCPWQMFSVSSNEGLYDVHLVIDSCTRSKNHQTLTVGSSESDLDSSAKSESTSSFVPIERRNTIHSESFRAEPDAAKAPR